MKVVNSARILATHEALVEMPNSTRAIGHHIPEKAWMITFELNNYKMKKYPNLTYAAAGIADQFDPPASFLSLTGRRSAECRRFDVSCPASSL